jgi:hypothetical protein
MQLRAIMRSLLLRYRTIVWESVLLLALMIIATLIAYEYDVFPNAPGVPAQEHVIETDASHSFKPLISMEFASGRRPAVSVR